MYTQLEQRGMAEPPVPPGSQDLIWCEGAIYFMGVTEALRAWRPLLRADGAVAFTEPVWTVDRPADQVEEWWLSPHHAGRRLLTQALEGRWAA